MLLLPILSAPACLLRALLHAFPAPLRCTPAGAALRYHAQRLGCSSAQQTCTNTTTGDSFPVEDLIGKLTNGTGMFCENKSADAKSKSCLVYEYDEVTPTAGLPVTGAQFSDKLTLGPSDSASMKFGLVTTQPGSGYQANIFVSGNGLIGLNAGADIVKALGIRSATLHPIGGKAHFVTGKRIEAPPKEWTARGQPRGLGYRPVPARTRLCAQRLCVTETGPQRARLSRRGAGASFP